MMTIDFFFFVHHMGYSSFEDGVFYQTAWSNESNATRYSRCVDKAGNYSNVVSYQVKIDKSDPVAKMTWSIANNTITIDATSSTDVGSQIKQYEFKIDEGSYMSSSNGQYTFVNVADGTHRVYVKVTDGVNRTNEIYEDVTLAFESIFVSNVGNDESGDGTKDKPFKTIEKAYSKVKNWGTIRLLSDLDITKTLALGISGKGVGITSYGDTRYSLNRTNSFLGIMIWINDSTVALSNIIVDGKNIESNGVMIDVSASANLNLNDNSVIQNSVSINPWNNSALSVTGTLNINGGLITNNTGYDSSGAIMAPGKVVLNWGGITYNKTTKGSGSGAIIMLGSGNLEINGGEIAYNSSPSGAGAIYLTGSSSMTLNSGKIHHNTAQKNGGAISTYAQNDPWITINLNGGTISDNSAVEQGGGVWAYPNTTVNMDGTTIEKNTAGTGGGLYLHTATLNLVSGTISENRAGSGTTGLGGGIYNHCATTNIKGGVITQNNAYQSNGGGGIYAGCDTAKPTILNITSGSITNNSYYGVVYNKSYVSYSKTGGTISGNTPDDILAS